jgi:hypothetical protein
MLAARFLYSPHVLLFPGTQERGLQKLIAGLDTAALGIVETPAIPWDSITRLVVVDTRQRGRISHVAQLLDRDDVTVELWDHHPDSTDDITSPHTHMAHIGSVTSLIVQPFRSGASASARTMPPCWVLAFMAIPALSPTLQPRRPILWRRHGCSGRAWM